MSKTEAVVEKSINFMSQRFIAMALSLVLLLGSIVSLAVNGLQFGLDFTGGLQVEAEFEHRADLESIRQNLTESGFEDANIVATEINSFCEKVVTTIPLNVESSTDIANTSFEYDTLLYFASPAISPTEYGFDQDLFEGFYTYYCKSFEAIAKRFSEHGGLTVYWPSTTFLDDNNDKFQEYVAAKSIGEKICEKLSVTTNLTVFFPRLAKISTDQTLSLIQENNLDAVDVAIDIAKLLSCKLEN